MATGRTSTTFSPADSERAKAAQAARGPVSALVSPDLRALRATKVVEMRVAGMTEAAIATELGISLDTVHRDVKFMRETGRIANLEEKVLDLVPQAVKVVRENLGSDKPDVKGALKVLELLLRLGDRAEARVAKGEDKTMDLQAYAAKLQLREAFAARLEEPEPEPAVTIEAVDVGATATTDMASEPSL